MKLGQLADMLRVLADAEQHVEDCQRALGFGGSDETVKHKRQALLAAFVTVQDLRDQELPKE